MITNTGGSHRPTSPDLRFLKLPEVQELTGLSKSTIYKQKRKGKFPQTVYVGGDMRIARWSNLDVYKWMECPTNYVSGGGKR